MAAEAASAQSMRVRISWGGETARRWQGTIEAVDAQLADPVPLGIEADEPGSMWLKDGRLMIRQRSGRTYDGVDLTVTGTDSSKLTIRLSGFDQPAPATPVEITLGELRAGEFDRQLDPAGNRLMAARAPNDRLPVHLEQDALVFAPGQRLGLTVDLRGLAVESGSKVRLRTELVAARASAPRWPGQARALWSDQQTVVAPAQELIRIDVPLAVGEGVYELVITATQISWLRLPKAARPRLGAAGGLGRRKIQLAVIDPARPEVPQEAESSLQVVEEIDPTNARWWERLSKVPQPPRLKRLWKGPLGNGYLDVIEHSLGRLARLRPSEKADEVPWEAYTLPIKQPGKPHVLEVMVPSDVDQTLGISILEPNSAGALYPLGIDSGLRRFDEIAAVQQPARWLRHRVLFWPKTKAPLVLITNRRRDVPAVYGSIRVLAGWSHLPRAFPAPEDHPRRLFAAYLDRPLFPENFSAEEATAPANDLGVDDWLTFYQGATRLVEYLNHVGYGGLMISVLADGSTIYPSRLLEPTPRYDTGTFLASGEDPVRKDVLEMLLRMFDREGLQMIAAVEFATPLPELERILRRGGPEAEGIAWIGPQGRAWLDVHPTRRGKAPYYNLLDPRVQEAMLAVTRELVARYAHHPSFAGLAVHLSPDGYAQLPGPEWGMDDATIARFEQDTQVELDGSGPERFARRAEVLSRRRLPQWLAWRAEQVGRFYHRLQEELSKVRPDDRLYLATARMLEGDAMRRWLKPSLTHRTGLADALHRGGAHPQSPLSNRISLAGAMLRVGIDPRLYRQRGGPVLLEGKTIGPQWSLARQAVRLEIGRMSAAEHPWRDLPVTGAVFYHEPQEVRVKSFDAKSPYQPTYTWLATTPMAAGAQNRRRFLRTMAMLDPEVLFDGSWQLPLGQEDSIRDLVALWHELPAVRFESVDDSPQGGPVTFRWAGQPDGTYAYVLNNAPFPVTARVRVSAPKGCRLEELTGRRQMAPLRGDAKGTYWTVDLEPYDAVGVRFSSTKARLHSPQVFWSPEVERRLAGRIEQLENRMAVLRDPPPLEVLDNSGFEAAGPPGQIPGWVVQTSPGATVRLDTAHRHEGRQSLHLASTGPAAAVISEPFRPPATGRLTIRVQLRGEQLGAPPPLKMTLFGGQGAHSFDLAIPQVGPNWHQVIAPLDDLPLDGVGPMRLRFDLTGPGEVWIDDVRLCDLEFSREELVPLVKLISPAEYHLEDGRVADCMRLLEGYWPRFLMAYVPAAQAPNPSQTVEPPHTEPEPVAKTKKSTGFVGRLKSLVPKRLRF